MSGAELFIPFPKAKKVKRTTPQPVVQQPPDEAAAINHEHRMARGLAYSAIEHAIECGVLLLAKKQKMPHGEFMPWIEKHCNFKYSTAARYMKAAAQSSTGVEISVTKHLSYLFPSGRPEVKSWKKVAKQNGNALQSSTPARRTRGPTLATDLIANAAPAPTDPHQSNPRIHPYPR